jgi:iron complex outermembrane recepter protein
MTLAAGIDNLTDRDYWREAPTQYWGGTYLIAAQPRTARLSIAAGW